MKNSKKIIVIVGQTSTGKSDFAVDIALKNKGEIISCDSRQVYKGMDLGTGKITKKEMHKIPHHLLDVVSPRKVFTVASFKERADEEIDSILKRGNTPILCGGTGFYIDAVLNNTLLPEVPPNKKLRAKLEKESIEKLFKKLEKIDPLRAKSIDKNNKVRLIRALEIIEALGKVEPLKNDVSKKYDILSIGLTLPDEVLKEKINKRLLLRLKKGMLKEIENLHIKEKVSWKRFESLGLEYRHGAQFLQNKITKDEMIENINRETWSYAKRQKTWFKKNKETIWIDPRDENKDAMKKIEGFLKTKD